MMKKESLNNKTQPKNRDEGGNKARRQRFKERVVVQSWCRILSVFLRVV